MSKLNAQTPKVFILRHGETLWAREGRFTSLTDVELTETGIRQVTTAKQTFVGRGKLVDPERLALIFTSPRLRAIQTLELFLPECVGEGKLSYTSTERLTEWDYGEYEGLKESEIRAQRHSQGLDRERPWNIWRDGCDGGESQKQVASRLDEFIEDIKTAQRPRIGTSDPCDILITSHGLLLRCFVKRWLGLAIDDPLPLMLEPGAIGVLSYKNGNINEPALHVGTMAATEPGSTH